MANSILKMTRMTRTGLALVALVVISGCSTQQASQAMDAEYVPTHNTVASADAAFTPQPFGLIAGDSMGLAVFGWEVAHWGLEQEHEGTLAEATN